MKYRTFMGYSQIGWLNILLFQWLFIRLQMTVSKNKIIKYKIIGIIKPCTGWNNNYIWIKKIWI